MKVGDIEKVDMTVARSNAYENLPPDLGVMGADLLLHNGQIIFDIMKLFGSSPMIYTHKQAADKSESFPGLSPIVPASKIALRVTIAGVPAVAMWDTHTYTSFSKSFIAKNPNLFALKETRKFGDVCGGSNIVSIYDIKEKICFGMTCVPTEQVMDSLDDSMRDGNGGHYDLILGLDIINNASWYFDFDLQGYSVRLSSTPR